MTITNGVSKLVSPVTWEHDGEQYLASWGGAVPLWGVEVAKVVSYLSQGGSVGCVKCLSN